MHCAYVATSRVRPRADLTRAYASTALDRRPAERTALASEDKGLTTMRELGVYAIPAAGKGDWSFHVEEM